MPSPKLTAIAAMAENRVIGTGDGIPWDLPRDRDHFRRFTADKALLLGRKTFEEMVGWFDSHRPVVLTSRSGYHHPEAVAVVNDVAAAIQVGFRLGEPELVVCGGASTYRAALPFVDKVVLTVIAAPFDGAATFPSLPAEHWRVTSEQHFQPDNSNPVAMSILHFTRTSR